MIGAILGDIIGSPHEFIGTRNSYFPLIIGNGKGENRATDDSMMTLALAESILYDIPYGDNMKKWYRKHSDKGYGMRFATWCESDYSIPYGSTGNGAMMRISPVGWAFISEQETLVKSKEYTSCTHNSKSAILAAETISKSIYDLRTGIDKEKVIENFKLKGYKSAILDDKYFPFNNDETCDDMMPIILAAFEYGNSYEECIRTAICMCTDTDTAACIVGSLAETIYPIPQELIDKLPDFLDEYQLNILKQFHDKYIQKYKLNF